MGVWQMLQLQMPAVNSLLPWLGCRLTALHFLCDIQERGSTKELLAVAWSVREMKQISAAGECLTMNGSPARILCQVAWLHMPCCPHHPMPSLWQAGQAAEAGQTLPDHCFIST